MSSEKKILLYTVVVAASHYKTKLFDLDAWKKSGLHKTWCELLAEHQTSADTPSAIVTKHVAGTVDSLEEYLQSHPSVAELLGAGAIDPPPVTEIPATYLFRFMPTFLLDRIYHASSPDQAFDNGDHIRLYHHPKLILHQRTIKSTSTAGLYVGWSAARLHSILADYINLTQQVKYMVPNQGFDATQATGRISELASEAQCSDVANSNTQTDSMEVDSNIDLNEIDKEVSLSYSTGILGALTENALSQVHRVGSNLWTLAASCFYVIQVSITRIIRRQLNIPISLWTKMVLGNSNTRRSMLLFEFSISYLTLCQAICG
jgi:hypothetical protein